MKENKSVKENLKPIDFPCFFEKMKMRLWIGIVILSAYKKRKEKRKKTKEPTDEVGKGREKETGKKERGKQKLKQRLKIEGRI